MKSKQPCFWDDVGADDDDDDDDGDKDDLFSTLPDDWKNLLGFSKETPDLFKQLSNKVLQTYQTECVYPPKEQIFTAFQKCPVNKVRVIILGQDPYHAEAGQAMGMSFSVPVGIRIPPSLKNIFTECGIKGGGRNRPKGGDLTSWAEQGVLLLNATLTVRAHAPKSHYHLGWTDFTDLVIQRLSAHTKHLVFMLWGKDAQNKQALIKCAHPSPLSANRGFFGCKHFEKANAYLQLMGFTGPTIQWE
jgi:uracil-DNA glycosylase